MKQFVWLIPLLAGFWVQPVWADNTNAWAKGYTPLARAVASGNVAKVKVLLAHGADVNAQDKTGHTPLHVAAFDGHKALAALLIAHGADVNARANNGTTPLMDAAYKGHKGVAEVLIAHGADVNAKANNGGTALMNAAYKGDKAVAALLIAHGADVNAKVNNGGTALFNAVNKGHKALAALLIAHGADVNAKGNNGATPLMEAAYYGYKAVAEVLIAHGAEANTALQGLGNNPKAIALIKEAQQQQQEQAIPRHAARLAESTLRQTHSPHLALARLMAQFHRDPQNPVLRLAVIRAAQRIHPMPGVPTAARRHFGHGLAAFGLAKNAQGYEPAIQAFQKAANLAPWWPDPYFNLAKTQELAGDDQSAAINFRNYLAAAPHARDAASVRTELYKVQYLAQQKAKQGQRQQNAQTILAYLRSHYGSEITYDAMCWSSISPMTRCTAEQANGPGLYWHTAALPPGYPYGTIQYSLVGPNHDEIQATMPNLDLCGTVGSSDSLNDVVWSGVACGQPLGEYQTNQTTTFETSTQGAPMIDYVGCRDNDMQGACDRTRIVLSQ